MLRMMKLNKKNIDGLQPCEKAYIVWDSELKGFGLKVNKSGSKSFLIKYRNNHNEQRKPTIGHYGKMTPDQARSKAKEWFVAIEKGEDPSDDKQTNRHSLTVGELCDLFIEDYCKVRNKPQTIIDYQSHAKRIIKPEIGKMKVNAVSRADIARFHLKHKERPFLANRVLANLSKMFNLAELWGYRDEHTNPCRFIQKYPENKRNRFLSKTEISKLGEVLRDAEFNRTETPQVIYAIKLLLLTGCRLSEILTLKWDYIDRSHSCFRLPDSKTGAKVVHYSDIVQNILKRIYKETDNPYVITGKNEGEHLHNLQKPWRRIRTLAGLEDVRIHDLRHSFASMGVSSGLSLPIIGGLLGHSQAQTTARYAHVADDLKIQASQLINSHIAQALSGHVKEHQEMTMQ